MDLYRRANDQFDAVLARVREDQWDLRSACSEWTVRDVAGHAVWAQEQLRAWATDEAYDRKDGAPGAPHPAVMAGQDPLGTWRAARAETDAALTEEALARTITIPGIGEIPVAGVLGLMVTDLVGHTWDVGHPLGMDVRLDPELVAAAFEWARANIVRRPGFFGEEVTPPGGSDDQTRMLAYLGRVAWEPVPA
jgi:uncharacterized protein (TIGR03086 family)